MTVTTDPRFNFQWGFAPGDSGWGTPYNYQVRALSTLTGLYLLSESSLSVPPSPADGDSYFVNAGAAIGDWTGHANEIASWQGGVWQFYPAAKGLRAYIEDLTGFYYWSGGGWVIESAGAIGTNTITSINGYSTGVVVLTVTDIPGAAPLSSPEFTGSPLTPNQSPLSRNFKIANTKYVDDAVTASAVGTGYATTTYVDTAVSTRVAKSGDTMTGVLHLVAPTATDNSDKAVPSSWVRTYFASGGGTLQAANTVLAGPSSGAAAVPTYRALVAADVPTRPYDIAVYAEGALTTSEVFLRWAAPRAISIASGASGSATSGSAATGTAVINIAKNGSNFGTVTYASSATGVVNITSATTLVAGDIVTFTGPASVNATLLDVAITLAATQS
jgi:hypothetical protein